jgi:hypothetical protein
MRPPARLQRHQWSTSASAMKHGRLKVRDSRDHVGCMRHYWPPTPVGPKPGVDLAVVGFTGPNGLSGVQLTEHNTKSRAAFSEHKRRFPRNGERTTNASLPAIRGVACGRSLIKGKGLDGWPCTRLHCTALTTVARPLPSWFAKLRHWGSAAALPTIYMYGACFGHESSLKAAFSFVLCSQWNYRLSAIAPFPCPLSVAPTPPRPSYYVSVISSFASSASGRRMHKYTNSDLRRLRRLTIFDSPQWLISSRASTRKL